MARKIELEVEVGGIDKVNNDIDKLQDNLLQMKNQLKGFKEGSAEFQQLSQSIQETETKLTEMGSAADETNKSTQSLKAQLREMTLELQGLEPGSARFNELTIRAGELRDQIADTNAVINATSGAPLENLGKGLGTATKIGLSGFQGIQGAMAIVGGESQNLQKMMVQLQGVMALTQAIESFGSLGDQITNLKASFGAFFTSAKAGFTGMKAAIISTGIGALVVAAGLLVAYWDDIVALFKGAAGEQEKLVEQSKQNVEIKKNELEIFDSQVNSLKLQGKSEKEILQLRIQKIDAIIKEQEIFVAAMEEKTRLEVQNAKDNQALAQGIIRGLIEMSTVTLRLMAAPIDALIETANAVAEALGFDKITTTNLNKEISKLNANLAETAATFLFDPEEVAAEGQKSIDEAKKTLNGLVSDRDGLKLQILNIEKQEAEQSVANAKEKAEKLKALREQELELIKRIEAEKAAVDKQNIDATIALMEEGSAKQIAIVEKTYGEERQAIIDASVKDEIEALDKRFVEGEIKEEEYLTEVAKLRLDGAGKLSDAELDLLKKKEEIKNKSLEDIDKKEKEKLLQAQKDYQSFRDSLITNADEKAKVQAERTYQEQKAKLDQFLKDKIITEEQYTKDVELITQQRNDSLEKINDDARQKELAKTTGFLNGLTSVFNSMKDGATGMFAGIGASLSQGLSGVFTAMNTTFDEFDTKVQNTAQQVNAYAQAIGGMIQGILGAVSEEQKQRLDENLANVEETYNAETAALEEQRKQGLITEEQAAKRKYEIELKKFNEEEKLKKAAFEADKQMKIASTITAGLMGAVSAFAGAMTIPPPAGAIIGGILAGIVGAMTAVNVAQIAATQYKGGTPPSPGSIAGGAGGAVSQVQGAMAPTPDLMGQFTQGQNEGGQQQQAGERQMGVRAYVLESDVTNVQNTITTYEQRSEIG